MDDSSINNVKFQNAPKIRIAKMIVKDKDGNIVGELQNDRD